MSNAMMRNLLRARMKEGVDTATIRAELQSLGLDDGQIRELAREVAGDDQGASGVEFVWQWLPLLVMVPGCVALGVLYAMMPHPEFAVTCFLAGGLMSGMTGFALRVAAKMSRPPGEFHAFGTWQTVLSNPGKFWKMLVPIFVGWILMAAGIAVDPHAIQHLRGEQRRESSREWDE